MRKIDLTGMKFGRLTVIEQVGHRLIGKRKRPFWLCKCECGKEKEIASESMVAGMIRSCGCLAKELIRKRCITHGESIGYKMSKELKAYQGMKDRCYNPNATKYYTYGKRGIKVCNRWLESFDNFLKDMGRCPKKKTLDRIEVNGNYEPSNCHWATNGEQARHRTDNVFMEYDGKRMIQKDWARELGICHKKFNHLYKQHGMGVKEIIEYNSIR